MMACERVRDALPGLVAGEPDEGGVREHLATCAACRTEHTALVSDLERVRAGLEPLAPSAGLETAVLEALGADEDARPAHRQPRPVSWTTAIVALAAVVAAAVIVPRWMGSDEPTASPITSDLGEKGAGAERGPTLAVSPPPRALIWKAREANLPALKETGETTAGGGMLVEAATYLRGRTTKARPVLARAFPPPIPEGVVHRWVYGDEGATAAPRAFRLAVRPEEATVLLGRDFLRTIDLIGDGGALTLSHAGKRVALSASGELEVTLLSPDGSIETRLSAIVSPRLETGALLPGPLGRALALHQFEIPGDVELDVPLEPGSKAIKETWGAHRCRLLVRVAALDFEARIEGLVLSDEGPINDAGPGRMTHMVVLGGETVSEVLANAANVPADFDGHAWAFSPEANETLRLKFQAERTFFDAPEGARVLLRYARAGGGDDFVLLGSYDPTTVDAGVERLNVTGTFAPGAQAVLARVWRDRTAIPSLESVGVTTVRPDGSLSFLRRKGEAGATLRMRLVTPEGKASWHDVRTAPDRVIADKFARVVEVHVGARGNAVLRQPAVGGLYEGADLGGADMASDVVAPKVALSDLLAATVGVKQNPSYADETGASRARLSLIAEAATPWQHMGWALKVGQRDDVRLRHVSLVCFAPSQGFALDLEQAHGWEQRHVPRTGRLEVTLRRDAVESGYSTRARLRIRTFVPDQPVPGGKDGEVDGAWGTELLLPERALLDKVRAGLTHDLIENLGSEGRWLVVVKVHWTVLFEDLLWVVQALQDAGLVALRFEDAP
jgi:hypothetical protein